MSEVVPIETTNKQIMKNKTKKPPLKQLKRGFWKPEEDLILKNYVQTHGEGNWPSVAHKSGLMRGGKSCRLRWKNYLRPNIKRGTMSQEEEDLIIRMHKLLGNRWSLIAGRLPGRTDNEVKNYWNTHLNKRSLRGKRKNTDHCLYHTNNDKEDHKSSTMAPNDTTQGHDDAREEDRDRGAQVEDLMSFNFSEAQVPPNYAAFIFDEDPFMPYFDSFLLFGALGLKVDTNYMNST